MYSSGCGPAVAPWDERTAGLAMRVGHWKVVEWLRVSGCTETLFILDCKADQEFET